MWKFIFASPSRPAGRRRSIFRRNRRRAPNAAVQSRAFLYEKGNVPARAPLGQPANERAQRCRGTDITRAIVIAPVPRERGRVFEGGRSSRFFPPSIHPERSPARSARARRNPRNWKMENSSLDDTPAWHSPLRGAATRERTRSGHNYDRLHVARLAASAERTCGGSSAHARPCVREGWRARPHDAARFISIAN